MTNNLVTTFEGVPFDASEFNSSAHRELEDLTSQSVFVKGKSEDIDNEDKYIFTPVRGNRLVSSRYVGVVKTSDGTTLEILPKIFRDSDFDDQDSKQKQSARELLIKMLQKAGLISYRKSSESRLKTKDFPLLEIFIHAFLTEVQNLVRKGLRKDYVQTESNLLTVKCKIYFPRHIKVNVAAQHKHFCRYNNHSIDSIENGIILTALEKIHRISRNTYNKKLSTQLIPQFEGATTVPFPCEQHFSQCRTDRHMKNYFEAIKLAKYIILSPPAPSAGNNETLAIFFNMAQLFEKTVEASLRENNRIENFDPQKPLKWFSKLGTPRPDYFFTMDGKNIVADAKWKIPSDDKPNSSDQYQLFTYLKLTKSLTAYIIYPQLDSYGLENLKESKLEHEDSLYKLRLIPFRLNSFDIELD